MSYELMTKGELALTLTSFDVAYTTDGKLTYNFGFYLKSLYAYMHMLPAGKGDMLLCDLTELRANLFDYVYHNTDTKNISTKIRNSIQKDVIKEDDTGKQKILDWFLPKQEAFAKKWNLIIKGDTENGVHKSDK